MTCEAIKAHADAYQFPALFKLDQLLMEMKKENVFNGFKESTIDFKPTYKYDPNTDNWDTRLVSSYMYSNLTAYLVCWSCGVTVST